MAGGFRAHRERLAQLLDDAEEDVLAEQHGATNAIERVGRSADQRGKQGGAGELQHADRLLTLHRRKVI